MNYQTFEPDEDLKAFVNCYWTLESPATADRSRQTIVPDGCMEMIFHYGDLYRQYRADGDSLIQPRCFVIGQLTQPLVIEATGETGIFSVRFQPDGYLPFATLPIKGMENTAVSLVELYGLAGIALEQAVLDASTTRERIKIVENFLLGRLADKATIDRMVSAVVETILTADGRLSVNTLSGMHLVDRRQLERKFAAAIGLSPKQLSRTVRLQAAFKNLLSGRYSSLTALAYENDYYDQAHFIKDFKELTGYTPKDFYHDELKMSALFYAPE